MFICYTATVMPKKTWYPKESEALRKDGRCGRWRRKRKVTTQKAWNALSPEDRKESLCRQPSSAQGKACARYHNGRAAAGHDHWNYQGKGSSVYEVPPELRKAYQQFLGDSDISQRSDIAITRAVIQQILSEYVEEDASAWRSRMRDQSDQVDEAIRCEDGVKVRREWAVLRSMIRSGARRADQRRELRDQQIILDRQTRAEVQRLKVDGLSADQVTAWGFELMNLARQAFELIDKGGTVGEAERFLMVNFEQLVTGEAQSTN